MNAFLFCSLAVGVRWLWIGTMDFPAHCRHAQGIRFSLSLVSSSSCLLISLLGWASQGSMGVSSRGRGCGSTFYFELPLYASNGGNLVQPKPRRPNGTRTPRISSNRVFLSPSLSQNSSPQRPLDLPSIQYGFHISINNVPISISNLMMSVCLLKVTFPRGLLLQRTRMQTM